MENVKEDDYSEFNDDESEVEHYDDEVESAGEHLGQRGPTS